MLLTANPSHTHVSTAESHCRGTSTCSVIIDHARHRFIRQVLAAPKLIRSSWWTGNCTIAARAVLCSTRAVAVCRSMDPAVSPTAARGRYYRQQQGLMPRLDSPPPLLHLPLVLVLQSATVVCCLFSGRRVRDARSARRTTTRFPEARPVVLALDGARTAAADWKA